MDTKRVNLQKLAAIYTVKDIQGNLDKLLWSIFDYDPESKSMESPSLHRAYDVLSTIEEQIKQVGNEIDSLLACRNQYLKSLTNP